MYWTTTGSPAVAKSSLSLSELPNVPNVTEQIGQQMKHGNDEGHSLTFHVVHIEQSAKNSIGILVFLQKKAEAIPGSRGTSALVRCWFAHKLASMLAWVVVALTKSYRR